MIVLMVRLKRAIFYQKITKNYGSQDHQSDARRAR